MIAAFISNALLAVPGNAPVYPLLFGVQLGFYMAAVVGLATGSRSLRLPAYFVVVNFAILSAWMRYARGERMTTWNPSERLRVALR
jgi:hypothetical protein